MRAIDVHVHPSTEAWLEYAKKRGALEAWEGAIAELHGE